MAKDKAYRIAEKKIEAAGRSGAKMLNLSGDYDDKGPKLTELPESLGQLTQLQTLNLFDNQLTALPESLGQLTQLQSLNLSRNQLTALPESLGKLTQLQTLNLSYNQLTALPESLGKLTQLQTLNLSYNQLSALPESLGQLTQLQSLNLADNQLTALPESLGKLTQLQSLDLSENQLRSLPEPLGRLQSLRSLVLHDNQLDDLPSAFSELRQLTILSLANNRFTSLPDCIEKMRVLRSLGLTNNRITSLPEWVGTLKQLRCLALGGRHIYSVTNGEFEYSGTHYTEEYGKEFGNALTSLPVSCNELVELNELFLDNNPLNPELAAAYKEGLDAVKRYLRAKAGAQVVLNEAKLILIGEGEVGKSCLLGALRGDEWVEGRDTTHGIEIKPVKITDPDSGTEITLNGWDFGGQRVYRPTHQLFFSAPAVYLVVWKPREGPQQGFVKEWIKLVKHREPEAKILVVATHGGPGARQPDIDRQELWDLFGKDRVIDFFFVDSKPRENGECPGIVELRDAIARVAASLPEVGRSVPKRWQEAREALKQNGAPYLPLDEVLALCEGLKMEAEEARLFVTVSHRLGHLIHYEHDPALRDIVVLKPDWLATAMSFVLDDKQTRDAHGLVSFARLRELWNDPARAVENRYPPELHAVFVGLMERYDLSYVVAGLPVKGQPDGTSLIAQLVPDIRPDDCEMHVGWPATAADGDEQRVQICRIVEDKNGQSASAEGLFYQLIVRLHKYSLGRVNFSESLHWQRGLVLDDDYNGRALLEHIGNDVKITVRAAYPEAFLSVLTREVKWLVESFWAGLRCDVMVPCVEPCGRNAPGTGLFDVRSLIESKHEGFPKFPCPTCNRWQVIDCLLRNAPAAQPEPMAGLWGSKEVLRSLNEVRVLVQKQHGESMGRFDAVDATTRATLGKVDESYTRLMQALTDEAKDGPRLFTLVPENPKFFDLPNWMSQKFRLTLFCEHSRLPLPLLSTGKKAEGEYTFDIKREWLVTVAPYLKLLAGTLSLVVPVASVVAKLEIGEEAYKAIENQLDLGQKTAESLLKAGDEFNKRLGEEDGPSLPTGGSIRAHGAVLRQLHALLKEKDPGFGGLVRVQNKRQEFLWVHPMFEAKY
jgi:Leucine-rich repeat (LRR) protein